MQKSYTQTSKISVYFSISSEIFPVMIKVTIYKIIKIYKIISHKYDNFYVKKTMEEKNASNHC